ncbi:DNA polymerase III subunit delta [Limisphaera sp. VF-2]|jgi:DNA polymerase-3 subunit delta|uniref:DNA polymerase III subunit delta n=1 Tax=Limisphaera sp. VF-2 TaxID=3400418 RepID=UPI001775ADE0
MPSAPPADVPVVLVCGDDEAAVKERARELFARWGGGQQLGDEILDGAVGTVADALAVLERLEEALQTLPLPGATKIVWLRNCSFLGGERPGDSPAVTEALSRLAEQLRRFDWRGVRLLISAGKVDRRRSLYKVIADIGHIETHAGWSPDDRDWPEQAALWARTRLRQAGFDIEEDALTRLVTSVGPSPALLRSELEKLQLFVAPRKRIQLDDVATICVHNRTAQAFALADALGARDLNRALHCLDDERRSTAGERDRAGLGLLYGLVTKVRAMLLARELAAQGWVHPRLEYHAFKSRLEKLPPDLFPSDRRLNPLALHPFVLHKALRDAQNYSRSELVRAMKELLECNRALVGSRLDPTLLLQQLLVRIIGRKRPAAEAHRTTDRS